MGSAYKNIQFMQKNFGGIIIRDSMSEAINYIRENKPKFMVMRGDGRNDYKIALKNNLPYILIANDISSMRAECDKEREKEMLENASAVIFTSEDHADYCREKYNLSYYIVIHTKPLRRDLGFIPKEKISGLHLVYAGGLINNWNSRNNRYGYRVYHEIFKKFIGAGWQVHLYSASMSKNYAEYKRIGCIVHEKLPYCNLLKEMSQYTAGLHAYNNIGVPEQAYDYTQICRGNKIWDYLAARIPTIGYQGGKGMKIYNNKWGIIIDDLELETLNKIPERLGEIKITNRMRYGNVMDRDIKKFKKVIKIALKEAKNKNEKKYYISKSFSKVEDTAKFPNTIKVHNKGVITIYRGGYIFLPRETSEELIVNMRTYKEIKAHVSLKIENVE